MLPWLIVALGLPASSSVDLQTAAPRDEVTRIDGHNAIGRRAGQAGSDRGSGAASGIRSFVIVRTRPSSLPRPDAGGKRA